MATGVIQKQYITKQFEAPVTIAANETGSATGSCAVNGYTPIGIVKVAKDGTNNRWAAVGRFTVNADSNIWTVTFINNRPAEITITAYATVLFERSS